MSYKALYRKYRPQNFDQVIGQEHIITTLQNIIKLEKISHAYLFSGPRGTGKTSVAYIFANVINKNTETDKNNLDIIEIDAASNNGVAEIRNLIDNSHYAPSNSKYKVYIIDEVHMLTKGAFNALLKTLEEPPTHLVFILATTEPHKIPITILSRVQRFNFKRINTTLIIKQLEEILEKEAITYEKEAIEFISRLAHGGMRDALSIVEQAASYGDNKISFVSISQVFGIISIENQIQILNLIYQKNTKKLLINIENLIDNGIDIERLINSLIDIIKDFIIYKKTNDLNLCSILTNENINSLDISVPFAYEAINEFVDIFKYIKFSEMKKQIFEISLLKLSSFSNKDNIEQESNDLSEKHENVQTNIDKTQNISIDTQESTNTDNNVSEEDKKNEENIDTAQNISTDTQESTNIENNSLEEDEENIDTTENISIEKESTHTDNNILEENIDTTQNISTDTNTKNNVLEEKQDQLINNNTEENITSTKDIALDSSNEDESTLTQEEDLSSFFSSNEIEEKVPNSNNVFDMNELINYLQHVDNNKINKFKDLLPNAINWIDKIVNKYYITLIQESNLISAGEKFIILSSKDEHIVDSLKEVSHNQEFITFVSSLLEESVNVIVISKDEFQKLKSEWKKLILEKNLPDTYPIKDVIISKQNKSDAEQLGEELFEELFDK